MKVDQSVPMRHRQNNNTKCHHEMSCAAFHVIIFYMTQESLQRMINIVVAAPANVLSHATIQALATANIVFMFAGDLVNALDLGHTMHPPAVDLVIFSNTIKVLKNIITTVETMGDQFRQSTV